MKTRANPILKSNGKRDRYRCRGEIFLSRTTKETAKLEINGTIWAFTLYASAKTINVAGNALWLDDFAVSRLSYVGRDLNLETAFDALILYRP